jgi:putative transposase
VVRNGHAVPRQVVTSAGAVQVRAPRVNDKRVDEVTGQRRRFASVVFPAWCRKSPKVTEVLPLLYLHGLSSKDFVPALESFLGTDAGLSAATVTRRQCSGRMTPAPSVNGIYPRWTTCICGPTGSTSISASTRESCACSWSSAYAWTASRNSSRSLTASASRPARGPTCCATASAAACAPVLAVGDGALGFWGALREVFPETKEQRCWFHKIGNVLTALPKSAHPGAKKALAEIWNAEDRDHARRAAAAFKLAYGAKFGKAVAKITDDLDELLRFYDYPAEHWIHLRTTNPIESTFATVRNRSNITKGPGSKAAGLAMAFKLIEAAQARWRAVNAPHRVALVRAGAAFKNGKLVERPGRATRAQDEAA